MERRQLRCVVGQALKAEGFGCQAVLILLKAFCYAVWVINKAETK
jgi:hypothetical protein